MRLPSSFRLRWGAWAFLLLPLTLPAVAAEPEVFRGGVRLTLVSADPVIRPGVPFQVGLRIRHEPGWHTYWRQPGIVGVPTSLEWSLPPGFRAGPIQWPAPERVKMGVLTAWGHERDTLLAVEIRPPEDLVPGEIIDLAVKAAWMACAQSCHPGWADLEIRLPVAEGGEETAETAEHGSLFEEAKATLPRPLAGWTATVRTDPDGCHHLRLRPDDPATAAALDRNAEWYFFSHSAHVHSDEPQEVSFPDEGGVDLRLQPMPLPLAPADVLEGVIHGSAGFGDGSELRFALIRARWLPTETVPQS